MKKYVKKTKREKLQDATVPIKKANDITRRYFLRQTSLMFAALGFSNTVRLEKISKLSKEIFGSPLAFAQGTQAQYTIFILCRSGFPLQSFISEAGAGNIGRHVDLNVHFGANTMVPVSVGSSGRFVNLSPQAAATAFNDPAILSKVAYSRGFEQSGPHQGIFNMGTGMSMAPYHGPLIAKIAKDRGNAFPIAGGIKIGDQQTSVTVGANPELVAYMPFVVTDRNSVQRTFERQRIFANGAEMPEDLAVKVLASAENLDAKHFELRPKSGSDSVVALSQSAHSLFQRDDIATSLLTPDPANFGDGLAVNRNNTSMNSLGECMATIVGGFAAGLMNVGYVENRTGDWHNANEKAVNADDNGDVNDMAGTGETMAGTLAATWQQLEATNDMNGTPLARNTTVCLITEFTRSYLMSGGTNNNDGQSDGCLLMGDNVEPGCLGNVGTDGQRINFNTTTGADDSTASRPSYQAGWATIAEAVGMTVAEYEDYVTFSTTDDENKAVKAMLKS